MNYEKLTPEKFSEKLKAGNYESLTGARRAIGKADWQDADKDKAREKALKHFGGEEGAAKAKPATPKKEKAASAPKKAAAKTAVPKTEPAKRGRKPVSEKSEVVSSNEQVIGAHTESLRQATKTLTITDVRKNPFQTIQLAEHGVKSATEVINALTALKSKDPSLDIATTYDSAVTALQASLNLTALVVQNLSEGFGGKPTVLSAPAVVHDDVPEPEHMNGAAETSPVPGAQTYVAPSPEA